jgi:Domain of unknown function (DUF4331)
MKKQTPIHALLGAALLFGASPLVACGDDSGANDDGDSSGATDDPSTSNTTTNTTNTTTNTTNTTTSPTTTDTDGTETSGVDTSGSSDTTDTEGDGFDFADDPYEAYTQIDRHAAVEAGTAGIAAAQGLGFARGSDISIRDEYNASNPADDVAGMWVPEITDSVTFFHDALDDDLTGLSLVPATVDQALAQAGPVIVPDTIKYDPAQPTGYPNGRALTDQVVDITLAAVLLELGPEQPLTLLADLPLNPAENDVPFEADFPYLAAPHAP